MITFGEMRVAFEYDVIQAVSPESDALEE